jgi:hypothetical protein
MNILQRIRKAWQQKRQPLPELERKKYLCLTKTDGTSVLVAADLVDVCTVTSEGTMVLIGGGSGARCEIVQESPDDVAAMLVYGAFLTKEKTK